MYIQSLIRKIPKELRELKLPYPGNPKKLTDREGREYAMVIDKLKNKEQLTKKYIDWLPFERDSLYSSAFSFNYKKLIAIDNYNSKYFKNLQKGDKITGFQLKIFKGIHKFLGKPSGNRLSTTPQNINLTNDEFKIYMLNVSKDYKFSDKIDFNSFLDNKQLVKQGLEWEAKDWPFGRTDDNLYGPHIDFDSKFEYLGDNLLFIIYFNSNQNVDMWLNSYRCVNEFDNLGKTIYYLSDGNYRLSENFSNGVPDIRLELER